ncbi:glycoside hydrolase family 32 protein [Vibrio viridaestus]|uniref:Glycoside hydrolase family 32 protein n=1 Tax=Vibrio viridaestus TaxID=2487322 RepID=A0A3N9TE75_9VIBR|nr:glycoside hydrolase family 32 protein [Vibrio viridaestus]RQW62527.1 glycoside hydrolase family 32 protein [Vibrio viridaestus]
MKQLTKDIFRPEIHFTPPFGWMNDPNGLVYINEEYHLFYQYYPYGNKWGPMHWGHAVSSDLLHWEHLPPALVPDETGMCFSGSAVIDWQNTSSLFDNNTQPGIIAFYTACIAPTDGTDGTQMQNLAYSEDGGFSWKKYQKNPILPNFGLKDFRDPKVIWHEPTQYWVMVVTEGQEIGFYRSRDLKKWSKTSSFGKYDGAHDSLPWECPDLFPINIEGDNHLYWILIVGVQGGSFAGGSGTQYFIGQFDGEYFINHHNPDTVLWLDYGRDYYAAQTWSDVTDGSRIAIAWMSNWQYANEVPTLSWRSAMSSPRRLKLTHTSSGLRLTHTLPKEWTIKNTPHSAQGINLVQKQNVLITPSYTAGILSTALYMEIGTIIQCKPFGNDSLFYTINRTPDGYQIITTRSIAEMGEQKYSDTFEHEIALVLPQAEFLTLTAVIDRCSSELLLQDGEFCLTDLSFDQMVNGFEMICLKGQVTINELSFCSANNISNIITKAA